MQSTNNVVNADFGYSLLPERTPAEEVGQMLTAVLDNLEKRSKALQSRFDEYVLNSRLEKAVLLTEVNSLRAQVDSLKRSRNSGESNEGSPFKRVRLSRQYASSSVMAEDNGGCTECWVHHRSEVPLTDTAYCPFTPDHCPYECPAVGGGNDRDDSHPDAGEGAAVDSDAETEVGENDSGNTEVEGSFSPLRLPNDMTLCSDESCECCYGFGNPHSSVVSPTDSTYCSSFPSHCPRLCPLLHSAVPEFTPESPPYAPPSPVPSLSTPSTVSSPVLLSPEADMPSSPIAPLVIDLTSPASSIDSPPSSSSAVVFHSNGIELDTFGSFVDSLPEVGEASALENNPFAGPIVVSPSPVSTAPSLSPSSSISSISSDDSILSWDPSLIEASDPANHPDPLSPINPSIFVDELADLPPISLSPVHVPTPLSRSSTSRSAWRSYYRY